MAVRASSALTAFVAISLVSRAEQLPIRTYTTADGLPSNHINRIVRDSRGFLWFCTPEGVSRFDGYQFTSFGPEQGLPERDFDLLEAPTGEYWVATGDGVAHFEAAGSRLQFIVYRPADPEARTVTSLADDGAGGIWAGTYGGLYHLERRDDRWAMRFVDIGMPSAHFEDRVIEALLRDHRGNLWIGGHKALYRRSATGRCERYVIGTGPARNHVLSLLEDHAGRLWVGTWEGLVRIRKSESSEPLVERRFTMAGGLTGNIVGSLLESRDGQLWIGTGDALVKYMANGSREEFENFTAANGLDQEIHALGEDRNGNLWVGSTGAQKISHGGFVTYGAQDGLASNFVLSVFEDQAGELCVTSQVPGTHKPLNWFDGRRFHPVLPNIPASVRLWGWGRNQLAFQDHLGHWWVPTADGLFRFPNSTIGKLGSASPEALYNAQNGLPGSVFVLFEDSRGDVWVGTAEGGSALARFERATAIMHRYSTEDGLPSGKMAYAFSEDRAGNVWVGFNGALARYRAGRFRVFETPKGLGAYRVRALFLDRASRLWVACSKGLVWIDSPDAETPRFTVLTTADGLASNDMQCVTQDQWGRIYVGTGRGVDCFYPRMPLRVKHYTKADGLALGVDMEAFRDRHGALWFGTPVGLSHFKPEPERPRQSPPVYINAVRVRGMPRPISALGEVAISGIKLAPNQNQVEIGFVGLGFGTGEPLRYQYRLDGAYTDWSQPTDERRVDFASLSPGSYHFQVRAITTDGLASATPASLEFTIAPAIWQRWWMRVLFLVIVGAMLYTLYRYRLQELLKMERLRTRIATDLHDDVGSTLSQIAILSEIASRGARKEQDLQPLSEIADLSRESVDSMNDIVWAIDPEQDRLGDLSHRMRRFANDLFASNGTCVRFRAPEAEQDPELDSEIRRQIFLIFKESLHNAARHSGCTEIDIDFRLQNGSLELVLRDNGKGFDMTKIQNGHGLASIEQRAKDLGGRATIDSAPQYGTTIRLWVPIGRHFIQSHKKNYTNG